MAPAFQQDQWGEVPGPAQYCVSINSSLNICIFFAVR